MPVFSPSWLWPSLVRAGAFGTLYGGAPGDPSVGLTVPVESAAELETVLQVLAEAKIGATLLIPPALARSNPELLHSATRAGHEIAGSGPPTGISGLEAAAGQPITAWALEGTALTRANLAALRRGGVRPLPFPQPAAQPGQTVRVLPAELAATLPELKALGYRPAPVRAIPGLRTAAPRDLLIYAYSRTVEDRFAREHHVIDLAQRADAVMRVAPRSEVMPPLPLPPHTPTAELHLHSPRIVGISTRSSIAAYRAYQRSLKDVAAALQTRPELADAQAVYAVTLFHGPLEKSGFALLDLPPQQARWFGFGFRLLRAVYGTPKPPSEGKPKMAWMEREAFLARHG
ncbi:Sectered polysaccharide deacetylase [Deinococcus sp. Arct2-2]|uniref:YkoP family protein n=1 Tax=Deinococcus sp. Arct2-2 TaxID=2568653 RepID=UPI0010A3A852|nr:Sectered polysaccharide deacetylase [Deinococcus sp. Arct2-2]THF69491.1 Sectered polysaccharide deacetylase [Deinococcus sp. Arct2-2]